MGSSSDHIRKRISIYAEFPVTPIDELEISLDEYYEIYRENFKTSAYSRYKPIVHICTNEPLNFYAPWGLVRLKIKGV